MVLVIHGQQALRATVAAQSLSVGGAAEEQFCEHLAVQLDWPCGGDHHSLVHQEVKVKWRNFRVLFLCPHIVSGYNRKHKTVEIKVLKGFLLSLSRYILWGPHTTGGPWRASGRSHSE